MEWKWGETKIEEAEIRVRDKEEWGRRRIDKGSEKEGKYSYEADLRIREKEIQMTLEEAWFCLGIQF